MVNKGETLLRKEIYRRTGRGELTKDVSHSVENLGKESRLRSITSSSTKSDERKIFDRGGHIREEPSNCPFYTHSKW